MESPGSQPVVLVEGVSKTFRIPREQVHTLKERALHPLRRGAAHEFRALRDVSFAVERGGFFGIVGRNGSGKSTLLKCLAGIYRTDSGRIWMDGRVSTFIELGVGFNPDLAARDNVLLNGTMLGLSRRESMRRFDAIVDFAELRDFVDLKVKNYSSGMLVRLAFSVMIQVDAEILLIDEVLAVGDAAFQQKCFDEFEEIQRSGRTVLLVTHDMGAVRRFCDSAMLLEHGKLVEQGDPETIGNRYMEMNFSAQARAQVESQMSAEGVETTAGGAFGDGRATILDAWLEDAAGTRSAVLANGERAAFCMRVEFREHVVDPVFNVTLQNGARVLLFSASSGWETPHLGEFAPGEQVVWRVDFENLLGPDRYEISASVMLGNGAILEVRERFGRVTVTRAIQTGAVVDVPYEQRLERAGALGAAKGASA
jgi:ABC-type polysaccharide/polyol phosphate transport system ATPase subunit